MQKGLVFIGMGFELLGLILGGLYLGQIVDKAMGWPGYGLAMIVVACLVSWIVHLVFLLKRFMNEPDNNPPN